MSERSKGVILIVGIILVFVIGFGVAYQIQKYDADIKLLADCNAAKHISLVRIDNFSNSKKYSVSYTDSVNIYKIVNALCSAEDYSLEDRQGELNHCFMKIYFDDGKSLVVQLAKDSRPFTFILFRPDGPTLTKKTSGGLNYIFEDVLKEGNNLPP